MSTNIFITGLQQLQRRLQQAADANRQAALERQARDVELKVFATPATSPINAPVRPIRSLLKGAGPTAQRGQQRRVLITVPPTTSWNGFWFRRYGRTEQIGVDVNTTEPVLRAWTYIEITSQDGTSSDVYETPRSGAVTSPAGGATYFNTQTTASGVATNTRYRTVDFETYLLLPIDEEAVLFLMAFRGQEQTQTGTTSGSYVEGSPVPGCDPGSTGIPYTDTFTQSALSYAYTDWEEVVGWRISKSSVVRLTSLPSTVEVELLARLPTLGVSVTPDSGPATRVVTSTHAPDDPPGSGFCNFSITVTETGSVDLSDEFVTSTAGLRPYNQFNSTDRYRSFNQMCHYTGTGFGDLDVYPVGPGAYKVVEEFSTIEGSRNASTETLLSTFFAADPVPAFSRVTEDVGLTGTDVTDVYEGLTQSPPIPVANWPFPECRYNRMDTETYDPTPVVFIDLAQLPAPPEDHFVSSARVVAYWDWDQPAYCRAKAEALGFTSVHLDPP